MANKKDTVDALREEKVEDIILSRDPPPTINS